MDLDDTVDMLLAQSSGSSPAPAQVYHQGPGSRGSATEDSGSHRDGDFGDNFSRMYQYFGGQGQGPQSQPPHPGQQTRGPSDAQEYRAHSTSSTGSNASKIPAYDRICRWAARRQSRLKEQREAAIREEMKECSFAPQPSVERDLVDMTPSSLYEGNKSWGYDEFVGRYLEARRQKENKADFEQDYWHNETRWTAEPTIPEPFELGLGKKKGTIKSLDRSYDALGPGLRHHHQHQPSAIEASAVPNGLFSMKSTQSILEHSPQRFSRSAQKSVTSSGTRGGRY